MNTIERVLVVGAGTMGHGIAHVAAAAGWRVGLHDVSRERIDAGLAAIRRDLDKGVEKGKVAPEDRAATLERLEPCEDLDAFAIECQLAIEAVPENIDLKRSVFGRLDALVPEGGLLGTNTSSLSISRIAGATKRPDRVVGMHFFNPVHLMPLLEIVRADETAEATVIAARGVAVAMGKDPIVVRDVPGFATSRLGVVIGLEAMRMLEEGVATAADIDKAMTLGYRHPMGPLRLTDLVGLDVRLAIAKHLHRELGSDAFRPPDILERMVREGRLGKKSGRGFYDWAGVEPR